MLKNAVEKSALSAWPGLTLSIRRWQAERAIHKTKSVAESIERFRFNAAVAQVRELVNTLADVPSTATAVSVAAFRVRDGRPPHQPMTPHLAQEFGPGLAGRGCSRMLHGLPSTQPS